MRGWQQSDKCDVKNRLKRRKRVTQNRNILCMYACVSVHVSVSTQQQYYHQNWCGEESPASRPHRTSPAPANRETDSLASAFHGKYKDCDIHLADFILSSVYPPSIQLSIFIFLSSLTILTVFFDLKDLCSYRKLTYLLVLSAASSSLARNGDLHFGTKQSHGGGHQHQVGQTLLHHHSCHICFLGCITCLL